MLLLSPGVAVQLCYIDILSALVAGLCHDVDHPGHNNGFEVGMEGPLGRCVVANMAVTQVLIARPFRSTRAQSWRWCTLMMRCSSVTMPTRPSNCCVTLTVPCLPIYLARTLQRCD